MSQATRLQAEELANCCSLEELPFDSTDELADLGEIIGQARAVEAVHFGIGIRREGFNLYVMGPSGMGKHTMVREFLQKKASEQPSPSDWCYVNNFDHPHKPNALRLPHGQGEKLVHQIEELIDDLAGALPAAFESENYRSQIQSLEEELKNRQEEAFGALADAAVAHHIKLFRTPNGFAFAPLRGEEVISPEEFEKLPKPEQQALEKVVAELQEQLQEILKHIPQWRRETREKVKELNTHTAQLAVAHPIEALRDVYQGQEAVLAYLDALENDVINHVGEFIKGEDSEGQSSDARSLHRYKVNNLIINGQPDGAPVVYLDNPTYLNLVGRAEHIAQLGTLVTDFTLIKPGALHEANGGYLLLDAHKLLTHPYAWEGLKRALYSGRITIEPLEKMLSLASTVSLEPEPIPLDVKVVILGDRSLYYLLHEYDPDFGELFKVQADFEDHIDRSPENIALMARLIATLVRKEKLRPLSREAVARVIDFAARHVEDAQRLTTHMRSVADLLREADYWAQQAGHARVEAEDIRRSVEAQTRRASRVQEHLHTEIHNGHLLIDTEGSRVGQINALSVLSLGNYSFGQPSRVTATVHIGEGQVVDIEREVELGGPIHSKGVLILSSFLAARYARQHPLSLSASVVFEQNYGGVEGDSASMAELCALLSAIGELPLKQSLAITGSVNQHGQSQPIGGVNEKIEGFFDICKARGLSGEQGVIIPASNRRNLMLRPEVVEAVAAGRFHLYSIDNVDQAIGLLSDLPLGEADENGDYPEDSINGRIQARLLEMALIKQNFADGHKDKDGD